MKQINAIEDLSVMTTITDGAIDKLFNKYLAAIICGALEECILAGDNLAEVDIGIGTIKLAVEDGQIKCKFIPSAKLVSQLGETVRNKKSSLTLACEQAVINKLTSAYKQFI